MECPSPPLNLRQLESFRRCVPELLPVGFITNWIATTGFAPASQWQVLGKAMQILLHTSDEIIEQAAQ